MRAMPSVSDTTVPCVRTSAAVSRLRILLLMSSLISDGFNCMDFPSRAPGVLRSAGARNVTSGSQMVRHRLELAPDRGVDDGIADHDLRAPDKGLIDADRGLDLLAEMPFQRTFEIRQLGVRKPESARDVRARQTLVGVPERPEEISDFLDEADALGLDQHANEVAAFGIQTLAANRKEQRFLVRGGELRIVERHLHLRVVRNCGR